MKKEKLKKKVITIVYFDGKKAKREKRVIWTK